MSKTSLKAPSREPQQDVQGVFQNFQWQAYLGYTYVRFWETPSAQVNTNGLNFGVVYYFKDWIGGDGEFVGTFGSQYGDRAKFLLGMGGARFRWSAPRGLSFGRTGFWVARTICRRRQMAVREPWRMSWAAESTSPLDAGAGLTAYQQTWWALGISTLTSSARSFRLGLSSSSSAFGG